MMLTRPPLLDFRDVSRAFTVRQGFLGRNKGEVRAVDGVSLQVGRGETVGLVGESGCGKSTLARMAVRLLPPTRGDILLDGASILPGQGARNDAWYADKLQMVFQDPFSSLNPRLRVGRSIAEPLETAGVPARERQERVSAMLTRVGLQPEHAGRYPHEFSGGQRQRIAIARALMPNPALVVCDEAVSALDASVQAQVLNLLKDVQDEFGLTYLFISHNLSVVGAMSDRVAVMYLGQIVEEASRDVLFGDAAHPYTRALLASAPARCPGEKVAYRPLSGELPSPFAPPPGCAFHPRCPQAMPRCRVEPALLLERAPGHAVRCHLYE